MAGRATVNRQVQLGVETTPGTPVAANKSLPSLSLALTRAFETKEYRSLGYKPNTVSQIIKDYGSGTMTGPLNYTEIIYPLNSLVTGVISTPGGATLARDHTFTPAGIGADAFKTFTIQEGDTTAAREMAYCFFHEFGMTANNATAEITGSLYGRLPTTAVLTPTPTSLAILPVNVREIDLFMDPTFAALGTTKITDHIETTFNISNKYGLKWVLNTSYTSFKDSVELAPTLSFSFSTEDNAQSRTLYDSLATNPIKYFRFQATGPIIEAAINYKFQLNAACYIRATAQQDSEGVWTYRYECMPTYTPTFPGAWSVVVTNNLTAL
jgi:hypothetical protein